MAGNIPTAVVAPFSGENPQNPHPDQDPNQDQVPDQDQDPNQDQHQVQTLSMAVEELLLKTLEDLEDRILGKFKLYLKSYSQIPAMHLSEEATRERLVQVMVQHDRHQAIGFTLFLLRKMDQNDLANKLSRDSGVQG